MAHRTPRSALLLAGLAACVSVEPARMALPPGLGQSERLVIEGTWPDRRGPLTAGAYPGDYVWGADRFDIGPGVGFESDGARARFALTGPDNRAIEARCRGRERMATYGRQARSGAVSRETQVGAKITPLGYDCEITRDGADFGRFSLYEDTLDTRSAGRFARNATLTYGDTFLTFESAHGIADSPVGTATPTGYRVSRDGVLVAALDTLRPDPVLHLAEDLRPPDREAVIVGAVAIALFKDPATRG